MAYRDYSGEHSLDKTTGNILNKHKDGMPADAVYIGRGSKWGNPFVIGQHGTRDEVCDKHRLHLWQQIKQGQITLTELAELHGKDLVCFCAPMRCHGNTIQRAAAWAFTQLVQPVNKFTWARRGGYECSSKGDKRFSALFAVMPDGRTIEQHYQCDVKGYQPGGIDWRLGKGKPPLDKTKDMWNEYLNLWKTWAKHNPTLIAELKTHAVKAGYVLTDMFATTQVNQARALAEILNQ